MSLRVKKLGPENFCEPDESFQNFLKISRGNGAYMTPENWWATLSQYELDEGVPEEVGEQFEVCKGELFYGFFYYPLLTAGGAQLTRILESASYFKCQEMGASGGVLKNFHRMIDFLVREGLVDIQESESWFAGKDLRNSFSHPRGQSIFSPADAVTLLEVTTKNINTLFKG